MIRPFVVANWKMHKTIREAVAVVALLKEKIKKGADRDIAIAPAYTALYPVAQALAGTGIFLAAQNVCEHEEGAYTGEVSARMLVDAGCEYVIIGHSERRTLFGEGDDQVNGKIKRAVRHRLKPIFCIGETLKEREGGGTCEVLKRQIEKGLREVDIFEGGDFVIAYEPVWAIGTGKTATPKMAQEAHVFIRQEVANKYGKEMSDHLPILYGGSVNPDNIDALMAEDDINGVLVGGASLEAESLARIIGV